MAGVSVDPGRMVTETATVERRSQPRFAARCSCVPVLAGLPRWTVDHTD